MIRVPWTIPAICFFILVIVVAHFYAPAAYSVLENTISDLAAQGNENQWIMQTGFIGFGLLLAGGWIWKLVVLKQFFLPDAALVLYGLAILGSGFYSTAPLQDIPYSGQEAALHSFFATAAGFALVAGMVGYLFLSSEKGLHLVFIILVTAISGLFGLAESGGIPVPTGIIQRLLYLVSFLWLVTGPVVRL